MNTERTSQLRSENPTGRAVLRRRPNISHGSVTIRVARPSALTASTQHSALSTQHSFAAFTLIELILAISIMSLILSAMSGVLYVAYRLHTGVTDSLEQALPPETALLTIQRDLANIVCNNTSNNIMLIGSFQTINQTNALPGQIGPDFYTTGGQPDGLLPWGDVEKVDYLLQASANRNLSGQDLVRAVTHNILSVTSPPQPEEKRVILSGVQSVVCTYYDGTSWDNAWDSTQQTNLPSAIKMQIFMAAQGVARSGAVGKTYTLVIPVDVQMSTNTTSSLQ
jgi:type II secretion system protein J